MHIFDCDSTAGQFLDKLATHLYLSQRHVTNPVKGSEKPKVACKSLSVDHIDCFSVETEDQVCMQAYVWLGWKRAGMQRAAWYLKAMLLPSALNVAEEM